MMMAGGSRNEEKKEKLVHGEKKRRAIETDRPVPTLHSGNGFFL